MTGLTPGDYRITAAPANDPFRFQSELRIAAGTSDAVIRLETPEETTAYPDVEVLVLGPEGRPVTSMHLHHTDREGRNTISGSAPILGGRTTVPARPGTWFFRVSKVIDHRGRSLGETLVGPLDSVASGVTIRLGLGHRIEGRVVAPDGSGVAGLEVRAIAVRPDGGGHSKAAADVTWTDASGALSLRGLGAGAYRLEVRSSAYWIPPDSVVVAAGTRDQVLRVRPAASPVLTCLDASGKAVAGVRVRSVNTRRWFVSDRDGRVRLTGLTPDEPVELELEAPDEQAGLWPRETTLSDWMPQDTTYRFERSWSLSGRVVDEQARPLPGVAIWRRDRDGVWDWVSDSGVDGRFETESLPPGEAHLAPVAHGDPEPDEDTEPVVATVGSGETTIAVAAGPGLLIRVDPWPPTWGAQAHLVRMSDGSPVRRAYVSKTGRLRFSRLEPGERYGPWAPVGDKALHLVDLVPSDDERLVRLVPAGTVTVRIRFPVGVPAVATRLRLEGPGLRYESTAYARHSIPGVPEGEWTLTVSAYVGDRWQKVTRQVRPGEDVDVRFE